MKDIQQRFWEKVDIRGPDECWPWIAAVSKNGYGAFGFEGRVDGAHRVSFILTNGPISSGIMICHSCDNTVCCNPRHLWPGTQSQNMIDCSVKDRLSRTGLKQEKNPAAKLSMDKARRIRMLREAGLSLTRLSKEFDVSKSTIISLLRGETWKEDISPEIPSCASQAPMR